MASKNNERFSTTLKRVANMAAFIGLVLIAVAIIVTAMLNWFNWGSPTAINAIRTIGECIAYAITAFYAFFFVRGKKSPVWAIIYAVCATIVVVLLILR